MSCLPLPPPARRHAQRIARSSPISDDQELHEVRDDRHRALARARRDRPRVVDARQSPARTQVRPFESRAVPPGEDQRTGEQDVESGRPEELPELPVKPKRIRCPTSPSRAPHRARARRARRTARIVRRRGEGSSNWERRGNSFGSAPQCGAELFVGATRRCAVADEGGAQVQGVRPDALESRKTIVPPDVTGRPEPRDGAHGVRGEAQDLRSGCFGSCFASTLAKSRRAQIHRCQRMGSTSRGTATPSRWGITRAV